MHNTAESHAGANSVRPFHNQNVSGKIVLSSSFNPWYNLALEEYLLNNAKDNEIIMYLWQNDNTVVIGKNQNPWKECRLKELEEDGGKLARRLSGGGAVYHDLGNLNFTFIMKNNLYNLENQLNIIISSLKNLGINAEFTGRNDITVDGKKISGNAFYFTEEASLHHGTLLVNSNMEKLSDYLKVSKEKIVSKGIDSVKARVVNLSSINPDISTESIKRSLVNTFKGLYRDSSELKLDFSDAQADELYKKYSSWNWLYGETPDFDFMMEHRFEWGGIEIALKVDGGHISNAKVYSDAMNYSIIERLSEALKGIVFSKKDILDKTSRLEVNAGEENIVKDIIEWIENKSF